MKKTMIKSAVAFHLLLMLSAGMSTQGQTTEKPMSEMKVAGTLKNEPVYEISVNNILTATYTIVISDENGIPLYEETLNGNNIKRKFLLNKDELGATGVVFEVYNGRIKEAVYAVKNNRITAEYVFATAKR